MPRTVVAALALLAPLTATGQVVFTEVSATAGIDGDTYETVTRHGLGVNWIDIDKDDWPDLFVTNGFNRSPHLFHNDRDGTFSRRDDLLPALPNVEMMGSIFADYDNDGDSDIYIYTDHENGRIGPVAGPPNLLLQNQWVELGGSSLPTSQPLFQDVAVQAGVDDLLPAPLPDGPAYRSASGGWLDYDRDGYVDLYVCHWAPRFEGDPEARDRLYRNRGDGTFEDVTAASGVDSGLDPDTFRSCLAFMAAHLDGDLWPDLYVVNVDAPLPYQRDMLFQNRRGTFYDRTLASPGLGDDSGAGMGVTTGDPDRDGDWDLYISDLVAALDAGDTPGGNPFYRHTGVDILYEDDTAAEAGVKSTNSWGVNFFDADQDGFDDLWVATTGAGNRYYLNDQTGNFTETVLAVGEEARGSAMADYDRDGDLDVAVVHHQQTQTGVLMLYRNDTVGAGHWLQVELVATRSNRDAIGTLVKLEAGGTTLMRQVIGGYGAHSQDMLELHFGLGAATLVENLRVYWPSGAVSHLPLVDVDRRIRVVEADALPSLRRPLLGLLGFLLLASGLLLSRGRWRHRA